MTILYAGGEDISFTLIGGANGNITNYRSGFGRIGLMANANSGTADPPAARWVSPTFTATSTLWIHAAIYQALGSSTANQQGLIVRSPDGVSRVLVRQTATAGQLKVSSRNAAGTITDLGSPASTNLPTGQGGASTLTLFDLFINYTSAGGVTLYLNGIPVITYSGDPRTDSATQLNQVEFANLGLSAGGVTATETSWSEIIMADQDTRSMALVTMAPQASGNTQAWTPNTLANINKTTASDSTFISTTTNNTLSQWTQPTTLPTGVWNVLAMVQNARVQASVTGPQHFDWSCRTGGSDYLAGTSQAPPSGGGFQNFQRIWATNPRTSAAWTTTDITGGLQFGIDSLA